MYILYVQNGVNFQCKNIAIDREFLFTYKNYSQVQFLFLATEKKNIS